MTLYLCCIRRPPRITVPGSSARLPTFSASRPSAGLRRRADVPTEPRWVSRIRRLTSSIPLNQDERPHARSHRRESGRPASQFPGPLTGSLKSLEEGIADHAPLEHYIG